MKILIIGANGLIGRAVAENLQSDHTVIRAGRTTGDILVDVLDMSSVKAMFASVGQIDAVVTTTGRQAYGPIASLTSEDFKLGLNDKVIGQINIVLAGQSVLSDGGSFTLSSGIMQTSPFQGGICAYTNNAAIESFVRVAATELQRNLRINVVSPTIVIPSKDQPLPAEMVPPGLHQIPAADVALSYRKSIEGKENGVVYKVWE